MTTATLHLDGMPVALETGGASRRARLTVEADGTLLLHAAPDVATSELEAFLASKRGWVYRKLAEKEVLRHEPVTKELVDGEGFLYLGRTYRLTLADSGEAMRLEHGRLVLPRGLASDGEAHVIAWYRRCGAAWLRPRMGAWAERLRVAPGRLDVVDLGRRWGSATGRDVRIHWATLQLPPGLVDYVLAHELAHLSAPHHGRDFWQLVARVMPDYDERKRELARRGAELWFGATTGL